MAVSKASGVLSLILVYFLARNGVRSERKIFTNTWAIHTDNETSAKQIAKRYNFVYKGKIGGLEGYYLLEHEAVPKRQRRSADHHTQRLSMDSAIHWSQQQPALKRDKRGFKDPLYKEQWYLENKGQAHGPKDYDINVSPVWKKGITGRGVVVTILDDGIEYTHPDLKRNYDEKASFDYNSHDKDPTPRYNERNINKHGTRCAGEVAADINNDVCGVGVAYNARIGGIRMLDGDVTDAIEASSLSLAYDYIHIYSIAWGPEDKGNIFDGPNTMAKRALRKGVRKGRKGLGSIFVWATGNGGDYDDYCNCDGYITSIYTVSIGAVDEQGKSPWYVEPCPSTLAVTYSGGRKRGDSNKIVTTDLHHTCTKSHTGSSAAAPLASGIFALALEANPLLTWRDLQHLIVNTSRMTDEKDPEWHVNSAGYHVNNKYGFGVLDADALVTQAMSRRWKTAPKQHLCREAEYEKMKMRQQGKFRSSISTDGCISEHSRCVMSLEHVRVDVTLRHERRGTLEINLISPTGTKSKLLGLRKFDFSSKGLDKWRFMTVFHWGENPQGNWTLEVKNTKGFMGTLKRWALRLYGTCSDKRKRAFKEEALCKQYCKKGCLKPAFSTVCVGCVSYCDCTTGRCTAQCSKGLETVQYRKECTNSSTTVNPTTKLRLAPVKVSPSMANGSSSRPATMPNVTATPLFGNNG